jgi:hypothetical protein
MVLQTHETAKRICGTTGSPETKKASTGETPPSGPVHTLAAARQRERLLDMQLKNMERRVMGILQAWNVLQDCEPKSKFPLLLNMLNLLHHDTECLKSSVHDLL